MLLTRPSGTLARLLDEIADLSENDQRQIAAHMSPEGGIHSRLPVLLPDCEGECGASEKAAELDHECDNLRDERDELEDRVKAAEQESKRSSAAHDAVFRVLEEHGNGEVLDAALKAYHAALDGVAS